MMKKLKKHLRNKGWFIAALALVLVGGQLTLSRAQEQPTINNYAEGGIVIQTLDKLGGALNDALGAIGTRFQNGIAVGTDNAVGTAGDIDAAGDLNMKSATTTSFFGDSELLFSNTVGQTSLGGSVKKGWAHKDCTSATSTIFSFQNTTGGTVYVTDTRIKITGTATATTELFIGTSTEAFVNEDLYSTISNPTAREVGAIMHRAILTANTAPNVTSTIIAMTDYPHPQLRGKIGR